MLFLPAAAEVPVVSDLVLLPGSLRRFVLLGAFGLGLGLLLAHAKAEIEEERGFRSGMAAVLVRPPAESPTPSQESIDLAMEIYGIRLPPSAEFPIFDPNLEDRGLTTRATFLDLAKVTIGPAAFASWPLLGSTLAHEIEVHCNQSFAVIWFLDLLNMDGVSVAERKAYEHEIAGAERFGLNQSDVQLIGDTVDFYYPEESHAQKPVRVSVKTWLARNFLSVRQPL